METAHPPRLAVWFLGQFCRADLYEEVRGDLDEAFYDDLERQPRWRAALRYSVGVVFFMRAHVLRRRPPYEQARGPIMLKNYLKVAVRAMRKHKGYTFINVAGLAVGIACCLLMWLYVQDELAYDRFHEHADRIVRLTDSEQSEGGGVTESASSPALLAPTLATDLGVAEASVRLMRYSVFATPRLRRPGQAEGTAEPGFFFADSTVFDVFSFEFLRGDPATALDQPMSVVLTASTAAKYFGNENPMGQPLDFDGKGDLTVTGVIADLPAQSHLDFDFLGSFSSLGAIEGQWIYQNWHWPPMYTYLLLPEGYAPEQLAEQLPAFVTRNVGGGLRAERGFGVQRLTDIHLHSHLENEIQPNSDATYVYIFSVVAAFILLIACINFMNLATARSMHRAKEVGMRKVLGAQRPQLVRQFLSESIITAGLGLLLAIAFAALARPVFNTISGKALAWADLLQPETLLLLGGVVLLVGVLAGSYPALYLSGFRPVRVLKGLPVRGGGGTVRFRQGLVVFQFAISCILIVGTLIVYRQLDYVQHARLGFDREHVVVVEVPNDSEIQANHLPLKALWKQHASVEAVTATSGIPPQPRGLYTFPVVLRDTRTDSLEMPTLAIDTDYAQVFGVELAAGRDLSEEFATDQGEGFLLNESAVRKLGLHDPLGQRLTLYHYAGAPATGRVVGVIQDFHFQSLREAIQPLVFYTLKNARNKYYYDYLAIRLRPDAPPQETLAQLETDWQSFTEQPFDFFFLDDQYDALYRAEQRLGTLFAYFAGLALFVACLGLFGLASFTAEQRTKEIGVRKVLGATVPGVVLLLSKEFVLLVGIAFVIAAPVAYFLMDGWLAAFAYHIHPGLGTFAFAGFAALLIAVLSVGYQALRTALANPVRALRYE